MHDRLRRSGLGEDIWLKGFSLGCLKCVLGKDEFLILRMMGGTMRHWKRNTFQLAFAKKAGQVVTAWSWQAGGFLSLNKASPAACLHSFGHRKYFLASLSPPANWDSWSFSCPIRGKNSEKGEVVLPAFHFEEAKGLAVPPTSLKRQTWLWCCGVWGGEGLGARIRCTRDVLLREEPWQVFWAGHLPSASSLTVSNRTTDISPSVFLLSLLLPLLSSASTRRGWCSEQPTKGPAPFSFLSKVKE